MRLPEARRRTWFGLSAATLIGVASAIHCGSSGGSAFDDCQGQGTCGAVCSGDAVCGAGQFCREGRCASECGPGRNCANGLTCSPSGKCGFGGFGDPAPVSDSGNADGGNGCADLALTLGKTTPTVLLLVDRSGSMEAAFGSGTRWTTLKNVLLDGGVIQRLEKEVVFGLTMYSNPSSPATCPDLTGVTYALNNHAAINALLRPANTEPDTPTGESILAVAGITDTGLVDGGFAALDAGGGEKIILLVTDGDPDYCANPRANDPPLDAGEVRKAKEIAVDGVKRAFAAGIRTYVLAIGSEVSVPHQQEMANTGLGYASDAGDAAPFFRPNDEAELIAQINAIVFGVRTCKFSLSGAVQAGSESRGKVTLNGGALGFGDANGWRLNSPTEIELLGAACQTVKTVADATLAATFPCDAIVR